MNSVSEQHAWATALMLDFAERLLPDGAELAALRASGASDQHAVTLYPVPELGWLYGIFDLTLDAELAPGDVNAAEQDLTAEQAAVRRVEQAWDCGRQLAADLHFEQRTSEMDAAWSSATDPEEINFAPHALHFELLLLQALAHGEVRPKDNALAQASWAEALVGYRETLTSLAQLLRERNWVCAAQHKRQNQISPTA